MARSITVEIDDKQEAQLAALFATGRWETEADLWREVGEWGIEGLWAVKVSDESLIALDMSIGRGEDRHAGQLRGEETLSEALAFLKGKVWPDAIGAALRAEQLAKGMKTEQGRRTWFTIANLIVVGAQDDHPYIQDEPRPKKLETDPDIPF